MIQDIAIEQLDIHPQNVRKVYTDIDELAESIKARGVMQNLTVVPNPDKKDHYLVVIGNRRLTAARKAGLKTMPCSVVEMTEKEQISTMLLENMQRSDLSVSEQAQGFQLMLDLGETETTIAEKTGFSRSTVRHRLNLAKLDQETLTRREENKDFQLTLTDLYELEKVQDVEKRNEILKTAVSSREIAWKAKQAVKEEKIKKNAQIVFEILEEKGVKAAPKRAKEERWTGKWKEITNIDLSQWEDQTKIDLQDTKDQLYYYQYYDRIYVVKKSNTKRAGKNGTGKENGENQGKQKKNNGNPEKNEKGKGRFYQRTCVGKNHDTQRS
ncbi:ParB/RepB/Spo0J family partition protein [[Ruminococcus] torques]|uniref:ParB/RepB/Spo0J family partition protein n=1 Tax=[Ruminococcus] torques TaxID=33039 RepID=UPI003079FCFF